MTRLGAALWLLLVAASSGAVPPCSAPYKHTKDAILAADVGQDLERKLVRRVEAAGRVFGSGKTDAKEIALRHLAIAVDLLDRERTRQLPDDVRSGILSAMRVLRGCIDSRDIATAILTVRVVRPDNTTVEGVILRVNDEEVGTTAADGALTFNVPAGGAMVGAINYATERGETYLTLLPGSTNAADITLWGGESSEHSNLTLAESVDGLVPRDFASFTLRFFDPDGDVIPLEQIEDIRLEKRDGSGATYWAERFVVTSDGSLRPSNIRAWCDALRVQGGKLALDVQAQDRRGRVHAGTVTFYLGHLSVEARLVSPPSNPGLAVGDLPVAISLLGSDLIVRTVTDPDGTFPVPILPEGNIVFSASTVSSGQHYYADAVLAIDDQHRVGVNLLHTRDKINRVPPYSLEKLSHAALVRP